MANGKVASYQLELRVAIADALINGRDNDDIRGYLLEAGLDAADLPSDHSIRTYQESVEYSTLYDRRIEAVDLRNRAGAKTGMAAARVEIVQDRALESLERWVDSGLLEPADLFKALAFTLQFQRQSLAGRKLRQQLGDVELPEPLGPVPLAKSVLDAFIAGQAETQAAAAAANETTAEPESTVALATIGDETAARITTDAETSDSVYQDAKESLRIIEEDGGSSRMVEEDGGSMRISQDSDAEDAVAVYEEVLAATGTEGASSGWTSATAFRNSPSSASRAKARNKRKKRRK